ncbi:hypothetical protein K388_01568 [Streptomyces sp. KhCrAH-43]|uniref:hypothetical protein n=1 Tax=unclassified Streptomyces TaxID=2593676 RepID=UPI000377E197|nr:MULTISPECIES: hypothetical protein [unclassified Streptomyces]MYS34584.1 hypothetical protein [Streptomyces sp. SID4920]MYX65639.1 hypothetical protein [Streptomyces sp. SID8373]RAJ64385.1 hypothetical protein K388_01568 [Streptomyces sp. KhCrAH-43]
MPNAKEAGDGVTSHEAGHGAGRGGETEGSRPGRRRLTCLAVVVAVLAAGAGGLVRLFQSHLSQPFGDDRACDGSDTKLPEAISAGGAPIPAGASDVHYYTRNGNAEVTFVSGEVEDYLHRAGVLPDDALPFDATYGTKAEAGEEIALPDGLCGSPLRGPVWVYDATSATGSGVGVMVERSPVDNESFRLPTRAVVTYRLP